MIATMRRGRATSPEHVSGSTPLGPAVLPLTGAQGMGQQVTRALALNTCQVQHQFCLRKETSQRILPWVQCQLWQLRCWCHTGNRFPSNRLLIKLLSIRINSRVLFMDVSLLLLLFQGTGHTRPNWVPNWFPRWALAWAQIPLVSFPGICHKRAGWISGCLSSPSNVEG